MFSFLNQTLWWYLHWNWLYWNRFSDTNQLNGHTIGIGLEIKKVSILNPLVLGCYLLHWQNYTAAGVIFGSHTDRCCWWASEGCMLSAIVADRLVQWPGEDKLCLFPFNAGCFGSPGRRIWCQALARCNYMYSLGVYPDCKNSTCSMKIEAKINFG